MFTMHISEEWLQSYLRGHLDESIPGDVAAHLGACDDCRARVSKRRSFEDPAGDSPTPDERRREVRLAVDQPASIKMLSPLEPESVSVRVLDMSRHGVKIWTPKLLERGVVLQIQMRGRFIMGEVRHCSQAEQGFHVGLYVQDCVERRGSLRTEVDVPASVLSTPTLAKPQQEYAVRILNQSNKGMLVAVPQRFPLGTAICICSDGKLFLAEVVHCQSAEEGFQIGIKIDQVLRLPDCPRDTAVLADLEPKRGIDD